MKKIIAFLSILLLFCTLPAAADDFTVTMEVIPPEKTVYQVGDAPDYTGGYALYTAQTDYRFHLDDTNCTGLDTSTPGNKVVTVTVQGMTDYFTVVVLSAEDPIRKMTDITEEHWGYQYFAPCMRAGYFAGDNTGRLNPNAPIKRAEMAEIIYRAWKNDPEAMAEADLVSAPFSDVPEDAWYYEAVEACRKAGIILGTDAGTFNPGQPIRREDAVLMLMRIRFSEQELQEINVESVLAQASFKPKDFDKVSGYARPAMALALGQLIMGNETGNINPGSAINRSETAAIFYRLFLTKYEPPVNDLPLVYLSPSNQFENSYAGGITTEGAQMTVLATRVKELLEAEGYPVVLAEGTRKIDDRSADANAMGADIYVPIHSNAGGNVTGTYVFYNGSIEGSEELSREIFDRLAALTGTPYSPQRHKEDYLSLLPDGAPFREIKNPTMPVAYIEVEFHDKADKAQWIVSHNEELAQAIANGIMAYTENYFTGAEA